MFLDPQQRTLAIGVWVTSYSVGGAIGPLVGGLLLEQFWWGSVFLIAVPVMALLLVAGPLLLPEYRDPEAGRPDLLSAALSLLAVLATIFGLKQIAQDGLTVGPLLFIAAGVAMGILFARRQLRLADPFLDLRLFRTPAFTASLATYGLAILFLFGGFLFLPQYLQLVLGMSPFRAGLWTLPWAVAFVVGSMLTPLAVKRVRPAFLMAGGLAFAAIENVLYATVYLVDPTPGLLRWRWTVCVALHATCSTVAGLGLVRIWSTTVATSTRPRLSLGSPFLVAAIVLHGGYNAIAVLLDALAFQF
jgi:DHA2 family multidrug resistance protein-like MFS transporter